MKLIHTVDAAGHVLCHDLTQIIKDTYKDARFRKGHVVTEADIPVLLSMGKEHLYVWEMVPGMVHENDAAERLCALCINDRMERSPVKEGKIELTAACDGLFQVDSARLLAVNSTEDIMIATRHGNTAVRRGDKLAGTDRKSTRLNSSHRGNSYAGFCLKKKINNLMNMVYAWTL